MRLAAAAIVLLLAAPAVAAPGDPRSLRGTLEWPASLSAEPFVVVRGDDGRLYYADVSRAQRIGAITGQISVVGVEGTQPHEIAAVAVGAGDSALSLLTPSLPSPSEAAAPSSLPRQTLVPPPPPAAVPSTAYAAPPASAAPSVPGPAAGEDLWMLQGTLVTVTEREFVVATAAGENVRVDVSKLSPWTRQAVRSGDRVKLFGVPQRDRRLVANGFIQDAPSAPSASAPGTR
jgi:hypothetical protein